MGYSFREAPSLNLMNFEFTILRRRIHGEGKALRLKNFTGKYDFLSGVWRADMYRKLRLHRLTGFMSFWTVKISTCTNFFKKILPLVIAMATCRTQILLTSLVMFLELSLGGQWTFELSSAWKKWWKMTISISTKWAPVLTSLKISLISTEN